MNRATSPLSSAGDIPAMVLMLPAELRERVTDCSKAIVHVLAWPNPVERLAALTLVEASGFCAVYQATHELPAQLADRSDEGVPA